MSLQHLPLAQITEAELQRLIANATAESRSIDYKRDWQLADERDKREFLADVTSFANAAGGDIVYGMAATDGVPQAADGLAGFVADATQLQIENLLRDSVDPRLVGIGFQSVRLAAGNIVFVIRVPRSWSSPHMVKFKGGCRFYSRNSAGKYQLDVNELRAAFLQSAGAADRIRDFRLERISRIAAGDLGFKLASHVCYVWHLMPLSEWTGFDYPNAITTADTYLRPMGDIRSWGPQVNFDGCMYASHAADRTVLSYVQLFRNGYLEAVMSSLRTEENKIMFPYNERWVREGLNQLRQALHVLGIGPPYFVALSLLNVGGFGMYLSKHSPPGRSPEVIDRPHLLLPEIPVESELMELDAIVRPSFDLVWNACDCLRSPNFDEAGKWTGAWTQ